MDKQTALFTIETRQGHHFSLHLDAHPSSGYKWKIVNYENSMLEFIKDEYNSNISGGIGTPGIQTFEFKALKKGITTIEMNLKKPLETNGYEKEVFNVEIF
jgi:predicted secreted protein